MDNVEPAFFDAVVLISGPVAAGKSTALEAAEEHGYETVEMGDVARRLYADADDDERGLSLSEWAGKRREEKGETWCIEAAFEELMQLDSEADRAAISGIRSPAEIEFAETLLGPERVETLMLWASQLERFQRATFRGDDFENFGEFLRRDARELDWGLHDIIAERQDVRFLVTENKGIEETRTALASFFDSE